VSKGKLMVVDGFAEAGDARNDEGPLSVHQSDDDRADSTVSDDDPCATDVLHQVGEGKIGDACRSSWSDPRRPVLDDQRLVDSDGVDRSQQAIEWGAVRSGRDENHPRPRTLPA
jgi:hypothetical protein